MSDDPKPAEPGPASDPSPAPDDGRPAEAAAPQEAKGRGSPAPKSPRPSLAESAESLYRDAGGFRLRLDPPDLARLRELPGSKGRTDRELGEEFLEKQAARFAQSLDDVAPPAEVRVVVDPYSRQAFLAVGRTIRSILSF